MHNTCPQSMIEDMNEKPLTALCVSYQCGLNHQGVNSTFSSFNILAIPPSQGERWSFKPYFTLKSEK